MKHILSTLDTANCYIESLFDGIDFSTSITRARFENELSKVLPSLIDPIQEILTSSGIKASDIDKVNYLVVNSAHMGRVLIFFHGWGVGGFMLPRQDKIQYSLSPNINFRL